MASNLLTVVFDNRKLPLRLPLIVTKFLSPAVQISALNLAHLVHHCAYLTLPLNSGMKDIKGTAAEEDC